MIKLFNQGGNLNNMEARTIKFRLWRDGEMQNLREMHTDEDAKFCFQKAECDGILMQFTGLMDKNGKEIYEGDIIVNGLSGTWIIKPLERGAMSLFGVSPMRYKDSNYDISALNENVEVIGNIYQNPELLNP